MRCICQGSDFPDGTLRTGQLSEQKGSSLDFDSLHPGDRPQWVGHLLLGQVHTRSDFASGPGGLPGVYE